MRAFVLPDPGLGNMAHLVDLGDGSALLVDPERDPRPYLDLASDLGLRIRHVAETHVHADFVSGARELVALGAQLIAPRLGRLLHPHLAVDDGDEVPVGDLILRVVATPGHTPEHAAYVLVDGTAPRAVFSGGTLMIGGVARPDLITPELTIPLAHDAHRSVRALLSSLPGDVEIRPTHGGGSFCSAGASDTSGVSTVAKERVTHPAVLEPDGTRFVEDLLSGLGTYPSYFDRLRPVNQRGPEVLGVDLPRLATVAPDRLSEVVVIDARPIGRFASGHVPGSVSNELRGQFGTFLGWLFDPEIPLAFVLDPDQDERELVRQALNVGHRALLGRLDLDDWVRSGGALARIPLLQARDIPDDATIVDVRQHPEWENGHVSGARHRELGALTAQAGDIPENTVFHCGHGQRAMTAASLMVRSGRRASATDAGPSEIAATRGRR